MIAQAVEKMIHFYDGLHDINHFLKVWGYAKTIGEREGLDENTQLILELAAIAHDIACPLCREKYGNTNGSYQEKEGVALTRDFYADFALSEAQRERICNLVGRHHTYTNVDGMDCQILLEADFLVNADESEMTPDAIRTFRDKVFKTNTGRTMLNHMYKLEN